MSKYGALWQHMFRLRRVQLALEGAWATLQVSCTPGLLHGMACLAAEAGGLACAHLGRMLLMAALPAALHWMPAGAAAPQARG